MKEKNKEVMIFKEQRVLMLRTLWNQFLNKVRNDLPSAGNHNRNRLIEMQNESMIFFDSYERTLELLLKYIKVHKDATYSPLKATNLDGLEAIKRICESIQQNEPSDFFLDKYGRACWHIYGPFKD